jgi:NAD(P)-dependent dehydrogenase (short-subunit alcohol dehydrogenase family)
MTQTNPHVVVIGGTSGIGLAAARRLDAGGATVTIVGRDSEKLNGALATLGPSARGAAADASDRAALDTSESVR